MSEPCPDEQVLLDYVGGALEEQARASLEVHLDGCAPCRVVVTGLVHSNANAGTAPDAEQGPVVRTGDRVGRYVVLTWLGAGGMGTVYSAYDPELDRNVALKLLNARRGESSTLLHEARLAARVSSPNVVTTYDAGVAGDRVFVAMELVGGGTLAEWVRKTPSFHDRLRALCDAGRGLAAIHASGIEHGDFKPENVLLDTAGGPKVCDFGLAHQVGLDSAIGGTPRFLAPERKGGAPPTALADQWSFAAAAWVCLFGEHHAPVEDAPAAARAPIRKPSWRATYQERRVRRTLERALASEPSRRFADMAALVEGLHRAGKVPVMATVAPLVALALVGGALVVRANARPDECSRMASRLDGTWDRARREELGRAFGSSPDGRMWPVVERLLDDYANRITHGRTVACVTARERRGARGGALRVFGAATSEEDAPIDATMACYDDRARDLRAEVRFLSGSAGTDLERAASAIAYLTRPEVCLSRDERGRPVPKSDHEKRQLEALDDALAEARAMRANARHDEAAAPARRAIEAARVMGSVDAETEALALLGAAWAWKGDDQAIPTLYEAVARAEDGRNDRLRAEALLDLLYAEQQKGHVAEARALVPIARAVLRRAGSTEDLLARLETVLGTIAEAAGEPDENLAHAQAARRIVEKLVGPDDIYLLMMLSNEANAKARAGRWAEQVADLETIRQRIERAYGRPRMLGRVLGNLAAGYVRVRRHEDGLRVAHEALALSTSVSGPPVSLAVAHANAAEALVGLGRLDEALSEQREALAIYVKVHGAKHPRAAMAYDAMARIRLARGESSDALEQAKLAAGIAAAAKDQGAMLGAFVTLGVAQASTGDVAAARETLSGLLGRLAERGGDLEDLGTAQLALARLLATSDPSRARALAESARASFAAPWLARERAAAEALGASLSGRVTAR